MEELWVRAGERLHVVALSAAQARGVRRFRIAATIHNGIDVEAFSHPGGQHEGYLVELARVCPEKGQHIAVEIARRTGRKLVLAGPIVDARDQSYFNEYVEPFVGSVVEYQPNVAGEAKIKLLEGAHAGVFPLQWDEPFGLSMVECMAAGVPVVALRRGAVEELVEEGVTGFTCTTVDELENAVMESEAIDRVGCAARARERFNCRRMAVQHIQLYRRLLSEC
jgi:glycosyltransferase involved in cell wall biosynthesis